MSIVTHLPSSQTVPRSLFPVPCFVHGFLGRPSMWSQTIQSLPANSSVALVTLPGHGLEPWFPREDSFEGAIAAIAEELPKGPVHLVGYSMGARVSLALALLYPEKIARATLIGVDPGLTGEAKTQRLAWDEEQAKQIETEGVTAFAERWATLPIFATQQKLSSEIQAKQQQERREHTTKGISWAMRTLGLGRMPSYKERLSQNRVPLHLITGALDQKFTMIAKEMSQFATHTIIEEVGHNVVLETPQELAFSL
jgi:2-succinyl-6-hydroxy-2,4-cyclohexadiene-1-carboxylate synthase